VLTTAGNSNTHFLKSYMRSKLTWIGVDALMFGFLEPLGRDLYEGATNIFPPYLISIIFGIIGVSIIVYDYIHRKRKYNENKDRFRLANIS
jgi:hypothetical protein